MLRLGEVRKPKPLISIGVFGLFIFLSVARFSPAFRSWAAQHPMPQWFAAFLMLGMALVANFMTAYQLWSGKASSWNWNSPANGYQGWINRSRQPLGYWLRIALWGLITGVVDVAIVVAVVQCTRYGHLTQ
jgi:hypothetical protein